MEKWEERPADVDGIRGAGKPTRRGLLRSAVATAATVSVAVATESPAMAQGPGPSPAGVDPDRGRFPRIDDRLMISPKTALEWAKFKSHGGPTYSGTPDGVRFTNFVFQKAKEFGLVDFDTVRIPYEFYTVEDWPDRRTHIFGSGKEVEKLVSDGTPVPVVASYAMTSGSTGPDGIRAQMLFYDPDNPPTDAAIAGKILVFQTAPQPEPPYTESFLDTYTMTDYEWRSPGDWHPLYDPPPASVTSSYHTRWVWNQVKDFAAIGIRGKAAGMVIVYDLSPGAAFGLVQRSVYSADGRGGPNTTYVNCPTLCLDRVNGAKVLRDAKRGKQAELTLIARFEKVVGEAIIGYLPGRHYGTAKDEQILISTHTDAMSLVEDNGALGMLGMARYFQQIPRGKRERTLVFYFDCRHFMPGGEGAWEEYDYYTLHPEKLKKIVATMALEHMGGRQTVEVGNHYTYSDKGWNAGGVITSFIDVFNNNPWLVRLVAQAATDNQWPRVDAKSGPVEPGINGGLQGQVKSPLNRGRDYGMAGIGLAGDWPGAWTQTYAQFDTEAGPHGFDENYFVRQVAGMSQIAGELMLVPTIVIDLAWGDLKSGLIGLADADFTDPKEAAQRRQTLVNLYLAAFGEVEAGRYPSASTKLEELRSNLSTWVDDGSRAAMLALVEGQLARLGDLTRHGPS